MIKTVIFDLGGVYFADGTKRAVDVISERYGVSKDKVKEVFSGNLGLDYRRGKITADDFWNLAKKQWGIDTPSRDLATIWLEGYVPIEGTVNIVDRLRTVGYELIFLSDNVQERIDYLEQKYPFTHKFRNGVFSHREGVTKFDGPKLYELALQKASHPAINCVYIDDKPQLLPPAEKLGMKVIQFQNPSQLETMLTQMGVRF